MEYKDIELTPQQTSLLKQMKTSNIHENCENASDLLVMKKYRLIKCINANDAFYRSAVRVYEITPIGLMWLQFREKDLLRTWYPHIVATLALFVSIIAIIVSIYSCNAAQEAPLQAPLQIGTSSNVQGDIAP